LDIHSRLAVEFGKNDMQQVSINKQMKKLERWLKAVGEPVLRAFVRSIN
jgi:hypothetical protein